MTVNDHSEEINKKVERLEKICRPYGVTAEVMTNLRVKRFVSAQEESEGDSVYELDHAKFSSEDLGFAVILTRENEYSKWSEIDLEELKNKILNSDLGVCRVLIEMARKK